MTRLSIQGMGVLGGFGCGVAELVRSLDVGPAAPSELLVQAEGRNLQVPAYLADTTSLERFLSKRMTRRIDHFSKMALLGAYLALEDAGLPECRPERLGVVIATGYGATRTTFSFLDSVFEGGDVCASPTLFSNSVHNAAAAHVTIQLKTTGPSLTVSQFGMSVTSALLTAQQWLADGRVERVLFGAVDEACTVLGYCYDRFFSHLSRRIEPFAFDRQTAVPGEGAAFFLLTKDEEAQYGHISRVHLDRRKKTPCPGGTWLLNADGHPACSRRYQDFLVGPAAVAAYSPFFGSLPVGQAFDLAVAALAMRDGRLPSAPVPENLPHSWQLAAGRPLAGPVTCLKTEGNGSYGEIVVERSER